MSIGWQKTPYPQITADKIYHGHETDNLIDIRG
jgi:hypothetical protein